LGELSIVVKDPLEKEIRKIIVVLIGETSTVAGVVSNSKIGKPREIYIALKSEYSILEKDEI
jgi:hypothetical protein